MLKKLFKEPKHSIDLFPSQQEKGWRGIYEDGRSVEKFEAILYLDGKEKHRNIVGTKDFKIEDRELKAENDPGSDDRMFIKMNEHIQGYIPYEKLENLRKFIFKPPDAVAITEEIRELGERAGVDPTSAVKRQFEGFQMEVVEWNYEKSGVTVVTYYDKERSDKILVTRAAPFSINANIVLALLSLHLEEQGAERALFLLLKYPSGSTASQLEDSPPSI